jgi:hypothetical protein
VTDVAEDLASAAPYLRALLSVDPGQDDVRAMSPRSAAARPSKPCAPAGPRGGAAAAGARDRDLHWIDSASEQFLAMLVDSVPDCERCSSSLTGPSTSTRSASAPTSPASSRPRSRPRTARAWWPPCWPPTHYRTSCEDCRHQGGG